MTNERRFSDRWARRRRRRRRRWCVAICWGELNAPHPNAIVSPLTMCVTRGSILEDDYVTWLGVAGNGVSNCPRLDDEQCLPFFPFYLILRTMLLDIPLFSIGWSGFLNIFPLLFAYLFALPRVTFDYAFFVSHVLCLLGILYLLEVWIQVQGITTHIEIRGRHNLFINICFKRIMVARLLTSKIDLKIVII